MIEGINICKKYDEHIIFDMFNFKIESGEFVCFSGKSGAGKTTLLHIIGLIENLDAGKILIDGQDIKKERDRQYFYRKKVGFLFQNFALIEGKTVKQNLELIMKKDRVPDYTVESVLDKVGLKEKVNQKVYTLSGGEQQRIALARLFLKQCDIVLADEPTGSLDKENAQRVISLLKELHRDGKTIILVTHDMEIQEQAERVIYL